jgi:hypothetical protein
MAHETWVTASKSPYSLTWMNIYWPHYFSKLFAKKPCKILFGTTWLSYNILCHVSPMSFHFTVNAYGCCKFCLCYWLVLITFPICVYGVCFVYVYVVFVEKNCYMNGCPTCDDVFLLYTGCTYLDSRISSCHGVCNSWLFPITCQVQGQS